MSILGDLKHKRAWRSWQLSGEARVWQQRGLILLLLVIIIIIITIIIVLTNILNNLVLLLTIVPILRLSSSPSIRF